MWTNSRRWQGWIATVPPLADPPSFSRIDSRAADIAQRLRIDAATVEIMRAFNAAGVGCRLLKGASLVQWLYPDGGRLPYLDSDLLVRPGDERSAEAELEQLRFVRRWDESGMPDWWREHGSEWGRDADGVLVDLHRSLPGIDVDVQTMWAVLAERSSTITIAGHEVAALPLAGRALHVALHAAQHGAGWGKGRSDLERALVVAEDALWLQAAELASELVATDAFSAGLRMSPEGRALAERLGLPRPTSVQVSLRATTAPPVALGVDQLARAEGWRARAEIIGRKVVPPAAFVRHWDPRAAQSTGRLLLAYVRRPFWLLRHAPAGFRAWWRARRQVRH
jgi:Uncharacterised nucleotidyltransferase